MADEKKKDAPAEGGAEGEEKKKANPMVMLIIIIAAILVVNTGIAYVIISLTILPKLTIESDEDKQAKAVEDSLKRLAEAATKMGAVTETPIEVIVNIAGTEGERFVKAAIILEYDAANIKFKDELDRRAPRFRDLMMNHLSALTLTEVTETGAKDKIRRDLLRQINATIPETMGEVQDVLFTTFIIQ